VMAGPGAIVQSGATIVGPCVIGADCIIEADAVVCRSVLWDRCQVASQAMVDHCVLTQDTYVEASARLYDTVRTSGTGHGGWLERLRFWKQAQPLRAPCRVPPGVRALGSWNHSGVRAAHKDLVGIGQGQR